MSTSTELFKQKAELSVTSIHAVIKAKDSDRGDWKEIADIASVSATGAGFYIQSECRVGTLLSLVLPLAPHLRCYDHDKELYRVWGLVQHCQPLSGDDLVGYHVGVAFIGKTLPESYAENPSQGYRICGIDEDGLWKITESRSEFKVRRYARYWTNVDPYLALIDAKKDAVLGERTCSENVSKSGAAVFSTLEAHVGDRIKFICEKFDFSGLAVVCNRQVGKDGKERLHLNFVENSFPVEKLDLAKLRNENT